ncbi:DNA methylase family protein [Escherichia coli 5-366-08_S4_C2]|nr:DNA methyltransferase [Escherichia coli]KEL24105.1 DNA methylase family protein [Escherichia coli 5-366-08_S4_C2]
MSRFVLGNCIDVMARIPDNAIDLILTDPPYLVGFRDRSGRTIAGDKTDEWLQPACNEMFRVLKKDALMVSFYGWNRVDRFMAAWKNAGFSVVGHLVFPKTTHRRPHMWAIATNALTSWQKAVHVCHKTRCRTCWAGNIRAIVITRRKSPLPACNR